MKKRERRPEPAKARNSATKKEEPAGVKALALLTRKILSGAYGSEQPLRETRIAAEENLSRNAVREALNQLVGQGVVDYRPFCGYRIHRFTDREKIEWYEFREAIEPVAVRRLAMLRPPAAIEKLTRILQAQKRAVAGNDNRLMDETDREFHMVLVEECGNRCFVRMLNRTYSAALFNTRSPQPSGAYAQEDNQVTYDVHCAILRLIQEGHCDEAAALIRRHISSTRENLTQFILLGGRDCNGEGEGND